MIQGVQIIKNPYMFNRKITTFSGKSLMKHPQGSWFIVFEGIDGCGKSTQYKLLCDYFKRGKIKFIATKEPTDGPIGKLIRKALSGKLKINNIGLQLLFAADRDYHLKNEVIPNLKKGYNVLSDRYAFSTISYGALSGEMDWFIDMNKEFIMPDITFIIQLKPEISMARLAKSRSKLEIFEKTKTLKRLDKNYQILAKKFKNVYSLNGEKEIPEIFQDIKKIINQKVK